jgi:hypothetical protein
MASVFSKTILTSLTTAALSIPGLAHAAGDHTPASAKPGPGSQETVKNTSAWFKDITSDFKYTRYTEDGPRYDIDVWQAHIVVPVKDFVFNLDLQRDGQTGGSQRFQGVAGQTNFTLPFTQPASIRTGVTIVEKRNSIQLKTEYKAVDSKYDLSLYYSSENDLVAPAISATGYWNFNKNNTILIAGAGVTYEKSTPSVNGDPLETVRLGGNSSIQKYYLALKQDLSKYNFVQLSTEFQYSQGDLNNPYNSVDIAGNITPFAAPNTFNFAGPATLPFVPDFAIAYPDGESLAFEKKPRHRGIWMPMIRFVQYIPWTEGAAHFGYRFGADDWHLRSHTFELQYFQPIAQNWQLAPLIRYYSQSRVDFYGPTYNIGPSAAVVPAVPFTKKGWTSDYRLGGYGTLNFELRASYQFFSAMNAGLTAGYYKRKAGYKMGSRDPIANTDMPSKGVGAQYFSIDFRFKL